MSEKRVKELREKGDVMRRRLDAAEVIDLIMQYHNDVLFPEVRQFIERFEQEKRDKRWYRRFWRWFSGPQ